MRLVDRDVLLDEIGYTIDKAHPLHHANKIARGKGSAIPIESFALGYNHHLHYYAENHKCYQGSMGFAEASV